MSTESSTKSPSAFPFPAMFGAESFQKAMADGMERTRAFWDEYSRLESQGMTHARTMVGESARMATETMNYASTLGAEWRKLSLEATRRTFEMLTPR
ncbi:MAG: hypothetical protein U0326_30540 [Polyangiales bacterium]